MIGVFNEKALLVSRLMKIAMVFLIIGICFVVKADADNSKQEQAVNQVSTVVEENM